MALSFIQAKANTTAAGAAVTVTISTTPGNLLVIFTEENANGTSTVAITDSSGGTNVWTQTACGYSNTISDVIRCAMFFSPTTVGVTTVTATWSGGITSNVEMIVFEISGAAASSVEDSSVKNNGTSSTTATSGALTTANANDILIFGVHSVGGVTGFTAGSGFTIPTGGTAAQIGMQYEIVSSTHSGVTTTMTWTTAAPNANIFAAFKAVAASTTSFYRMPVFFLG
jgi:hypothetical protein